MGDVQASSGESAAGVCLSRIGHAAHAERALNAVAPFQGGVEAARGVGHLAIVLRGLRIGAFAAVAACGLPE